LLIEGPLRSGQSIVFPRGDVTLVGSISSGAEVVAGESIHVYGAIRGRALTGVNGSPEGADFLQQGRARTASDRWFLSDCGKTSMLHCTAERYKLGSNATCCGFRQSIETGGKMGPLLAPGCVPEPLVLEVRPCGRHRAKDPVGRNSPTGIEKHITSV
jgi:hypothetical protein